jgi:hypothetical protein
LSNGVFASRLAAAIPADTDPRLAQVFQNPEALINPQAQTRIQQIAQQLGPGGQALIQQLGSAAHSAMIAGIRTGYSMALGSGALVLILVLLMKVPSFLSTPKDEPLGHEGAMETI